VSRFFLGPVPIDPVTRDEALDRIARLVEAGGGGTVFTPNVDHFVLADENRAFREAYAAASLSLIDGMPLLWASRLLGHAVPEKVSGSDLLRPLVLRAARERWRVYLFGAAPGVAERAAARLLEEYPGLEVAGAEGPQVDLGVPRETRMDAVRRIRDSRPHLVLVALGGLKAEIWSREAADSLRPAVVVAVGAALDFLTGAQRRAPSWMSRAGLEWLHRLASDPRRLARRYLLRDPKFAPMVLRLLWETYARRRRADQLPTDS
jgi:N-acetylglucosaminyldiphosphoundecaprenol N-acetyl-beta-D-mannosaminyltransferase